MEKEVKKADKRVGLRSWLRLHRQMGDFIFEHGDQTISMFLLIGIVQSLNREHYGDVLRSIIKAVGRSDDEAGITRLTHELATRVDYILDNEQRKQMLATALAVEL